MVRVTGLIRVPARHDDCHAAGEQDRGRRLTQTEREFAPVPAGHVDDRDPHALVAAVLMTTMGCGEVAPPRWWTEPARCNLVVTARRS